MNQYEFGQNQLKKLDYESDLLTDEMNQRLKQVLQQSQNKQTYEYPEILQDILSDDPLITYNGLICLNKYFDTDRDPALPQVVDNQLITCLFKIIKTRQTPYHQYQALKSLIYIGQQLKQSYEKIIDKGIIQIHIDIIKHDIYELTQLSLQSLGVFAKNRKLCHRIIQGSGQDIILQLLMRENDIQIQRSGNYFLLCLILFAASLIVYPNKQSCQCDNILTETECNLKTFCEWESNKNLGKCIPEKNNQETQLIISYCSIQQNNWRCAQTFGCAQISKNCEAFAGCSAYRYSSNSACQSISTQCTTDGRQCVEIKSCSDYKIQKHCIKNNSSSGAKSCLWNSENSTCIDKNCTNAPKSYKTNRQCDQWIKGCLTKGRGCVEKLSECRTYKRNVGCNNYFGSDGACTIDVHSDNCRKLECEDAFKRQNTDQKCSAFLKNCVTNGKGCVKTLIPCYQYTKNQGCIGLIGSDGPCTFDKQSNHCRVLECREAPITLNTNENCKIFKSGCVTTGRGCTNMLGPCSSYKGTETTCSNFIGSDGYCIGLELSPSYCRAKSCYDAPLTYNSDAECQEFQIGCITTGMGCGKYLKLCNQYYGTYLTCLKYIGLDGKCTAPQTQISETSCVKKQCKDAPTNISTNSECESFQSNCVTTGSGCTEKPSTCESNNMLTNCQSNSQCSNFQICINTSSCENFKTASQCYLNQQQYYSEGQTYLRRCIWSAVEQLCFNSQCKDQSNSLIFFCDQMLNGCITNGQGCVEKFEPCSSYFGIRSQCLLFKGQNGTIRCSQLQSVSDSTTQCINREKCSQVKEEGIFVDSNLRCQQYLQGCHFDGRDSCTNGDCTSYFGTQVFCGQITTAVKEGVAQQCWKMQDIADQTTPCIPKDCSQTQLDNAYKTNEQCSTFSNQCTWNQEQYGGCVYKSTSYTLFSGNFQKCQQTQNQSKQLCRSIICSNKIPPYSAKTFTLKATYCQQYNNQFNGYTCQMGLDDIDVCVEPKESSCNLFVAIGSDDQQKAIYCQSLKNPGNSACGYSNGDFCTQAACNQFLAIGDTAELKAQYCHGIIIDGVIQCGLNSSTAQYCTVKACTDYGVTTLTKCNQYTESICAWNIVTSICYQKTSQCNQHSIPQTSSSNELQKATYCRVIQLLDTLNACVYLSTISLTLCSNSPASCNDITIPPTITTNFEKAQFCAITRIQDGNNYCGYSSANLTSCITAGSCTSYQINLINQVGTDLDNQRFCQTLRDINGKYCSYVKNTTTCTLNLICQDLVTYGSTYAENITFCRQQQEEWRFRYCDYVSSTTCTAADCTLITTGQTSCLSYFLGCVFDGLNCLAKQIDCSFYTAQTTGLGQYLNCAALTQIDGTKCEWSSGSNCSVRKCSSLTSGQSFSTCADFADCQYNGQICVSKDKCESYVPFGNSNQVKIAICNQMINKFGLMCTFSIDQQTCIEAVGCQNIQIQSIEFSQAQELCSLAQNQFGLHCVYIQGDTTCSEKSCEQVQTATSDADCNAYLQGCELAPLEADCTEFQCTDAPSSLTTNQDCWTFKIGCITNGSGCINQLAPCQSYKGNQQTCQKFIGNGILCNNSDDANSMSNCINRTCSQNKIANSNEECALWKGISSQQCVWNGTKGCISIQQCNKFIGNIGSCPIYIASDGPCAGIGSNPQACINICRTAPITYYGDEQCKKLDKNCIATGFGCIHILEAQCEIIKTSDACVSYKTTPGLYCDMINQCKTRPQNCEDIKFASECDITKFYGDNPFQCIWNPEISSCLNKKCEQLPSSLKSDDECSGQIAKCIKNGSQLGCITKGPCNSYQFEVCGIVQTTDNQKKCIWSNSKCRPIECSDNVTATSDYACSSFLAGCKTSGLGCQSNIVCSHYTNPNLCIYDGLGYPCSWYKSSPLSSGSCISYAKCTDLIQQTHSACQLASKYCTTNGQNCVPLTFCENFLTQAGCIIGIDGQCGWLPESRDNKASCKLFTVCGDGYGKTAKECLAWGENCYTDGTQCMTKQKCSDYITKIACGNIGKDGVCFWEQPDNQTGYCRVQLCQDASNIDVTSYYGCSQFPAQKNCTTSGSSCIELTNCSLYKFAVSCVMGTDGVCQWVQAKDQTQSYCRLKQCSDILLSSSNSCDSDLTQFKCISDGATCIQQSQCSLYTAKNSCDQGGLDGICAFTPKESSNAGTCQLFTSCQIADFDERACKTRQDACFFEKTPDQENSQCLPHTCLTKAQGSKCQPIPSWDLQNYRICILEGSICVDGDPKSLSSADCFNQSLGTYSWNPSTSTCEACKKQDPKSIDLIQLFVIFILII